MKNKIASWVFGALMILLLASLVFSCKTTKKIDKAVTKTDSAVHKISLNDSTAKLLNVIQTQKTDTSNVTEEAGWEKHAVDSGETVIVSNGTATDYLEIIPAAKKRTIYLPKTTRIENKKSITTENKTEAKTVEVKKKTDEAIAVKKEEKTVKKDIKRSSFGIVWLLWLLVPLAAYSLYAYKKHKFPFNIKIG